MQDMSKHIILYSVQYIPLWLYVYMHNINVYRGGIMSFFKPQ